MLCLAVFLSILLGIACSIAFSLAKFLVKLTEEFHWKWLVLTVLYVLITSYLGELTTISWAVFYFSCAANYEQDAPIEHLDDQLEAGYLPIDPALAKESPSSV